MNQKIYREELPFYLYCLHATLQIPVNKISVIKFNIFCYAQTYESMTNSDFNTKNKTEYGTSHLYDVQILVIIKDQNLTTRVITR